MYTAIREIYENGELTLLEPAPTSGKAEVLIMFLEEVKSNKSQKRVLEGLKHLGGNIPDDFNDPLADLKEYM